MNIVYIMCLQPTYVRTSGTLQSSLGHECTDSCPWSTCLQGRPRDRETGYSACPYQNPHTAHQNGSSTCRAASASDSAWQTRSTLCSSVLHDCGRTCNGELIPTVSMSVMPHDSHMITASQRITEWHTCTYVLCQHPFCAMRGRGG